MLCLDSPLYDEEFAALVGCSLERACAVLRRLRRQESLTYKEKFPHLAAEIAPSEALKLVYALHEANADRNLWRLRKCHFVALYDSLSLELSRREYFPESARRPLNFSGLVAGWRYLQFLHGDVTWTADIKSTRHELLRIHGIPRALRLIPTGADLSERRVAWDL